MSIKKRKGYISQNQNRVQPRRCPVCRVLLDGATGIHLDEQPAAPPVPTPGDVTVCAYCSTILVVTVTAFREATDDDLATLDTDVVAVLRALQTMPPRSGRGTQH